MKFDDVFYFHAHYGFEGENWEERDEYGFIVASNFKDAMSQIVDNYREDLLSVEIQYVGDTGIITVNNKEVAEVFKKSYIKTHYGEDE